MHGTMHVAPKKVSLLRTVLAVALFIYTVGTSAPVAGQDTGADNGAERAGSVNGTGTGEPPAIDSVWYTPRKPRILNVVSIGVSAQRAETIEVDFGAGFYSSYNHVYLSFGAKTVTIRATNTEGSVETSIRIVVRGYFTVTADQSEVQHDASGAPVTTATIGGFGTFDLVRVYRETTEVLAIGGNQRRIDIPVPFVGTETFGVLLFDRGNPVALPETITLTGLNKPPGKPYFEGPAIVKSPPGQSIEFQVFADDPNNDPLRFEAQRLPPNAEFDTSTGRFSWTPEGNQIGSWLVTFFAYDVPYDERTSFRQRTFLITQ